MLLYADSLRAPNPRAALGVGLVLAATICISGSAVYVRGRCRTDDPFALNAVAMAIGGGVLWLLSLAFEQPWPTVTRLAWFTIVWLALFSSVLCFGIYWWLLRWIEVSRASLTCFLIPLVTIVLGRLLLHETMQPVTALATAIVLGGVAVTLTDRGPKAARLIPPEPVA